MTHSERVLEFMSNTCTFFTAMSSPASREAVPQ